MESFKKPSGNRSSITSPDTERFPKYLMAEFSEIATSLIEPAGVPEIKSIAMILKTDGSANPKFSSLTVSVP